MRFKVLLLPGVLLKPQHINVSKTSTCPDQAVIPLRGILNVSRCLRVLQINRDYGRLLTLNSMLQGIEFLKLRYPNLYRRLNEIADEKETKSKNEDSHNLLKKQLAAYQTELEGDLETVEKDGDDDKVQDADQALTDGQLKEELKNVEKGGDHDKVQDADQASIDLLFGILRDWTYIAAGAPGPWTRHPETPLGKLVSDQYERIGPVRPMPDQFERSQPDAGVFVSPGSSECLPTLTIIENRYRSDPRRYRDRPGESQVVEYSRWCINAYKCYDVVHMGMTMTEFPGILCRIFALPSCCLTGGRKLAVVVVTKTTTLITLSTEQHREQRLLTSGTSRTIGFVRFIVCYASFPRHLAIKGHLCYKE